MALLRVIDVIEDETVVLQTDPYVAFVMERVAEDYPVVYWRTGDLQMSMVEVTLVSERGILQRIATTALTGARRTADRGDSPETRWRRGLPCCDVSGVTPLRAVDDARELLVHATADAVWVRFGHVIAASGLVSGRVSFLLDRDERLCGLGFTGLTLEERELVEPLLPGKTT